MTDLNIPTLTADLTAAGLTPIIIDENTDMNAITEIPSDIIEVDNALAQTSLIDKVQLAAKLLGKGFAKLDKIAVTMAELEALRDETKQQVADAMAAGGIGFDAASKAFRQANNKFDRVLDTRTAQLNDLNAGIAALRGLLDDLETEIAVMLEE